VFLDDAKFKEFWKSNKRYYLVSYPRRLERIEGLVGKENLHVAAMSGGKIAVTNLDVNNGK